MTAASSLERQPGRGSSALVHPKRVAVLNERVR